MTTLEQRRQDATARFARDIMGNDRLADRLASRIESAVQEITDQEAAERDALDGRAAEVLRRELDETGEWLNPQQRRDYLRAVAAVREFYEECRADSAPEPARHRGDPAVTDIDGFAIFTESAPEPQVFGNAVDIPDKCWFRSGEPDVTVAWYRQGGEYWRQRIGSTVPAEGPFTARHVDGLYPQRSSFGYLLMDGGAQ